MGAGLATLLEFADPAVRCRDVIIEITGLPVIATLNRISPDDYSMTTSANLTPSALSQP